MKDMVLRPFLFALAIVVLAVCVVRPLAAQHEAVRIRVADVTVEAARSAPLTRWTKVPGTVEARRRVLVASELQGRVVEVLVDEGDRVVAGQLLLRFDEAEARAHVDRLEAALAACDAGLALREAGATSEERAAARAAQREAEAHLEGTRRESERLRELLARKAASRQQVDGAEMAHRAAEAAAEAARQRCRRVLAGARAEEIAMARARCRETAAQLRLAEIHLARCRITSPVDAVVTRRAVEPGEVVSQTTLGTPLLELSVLDPVRVVAHVPDRELALLRPGLPVRCRSQAWTEVFEGTLCHVAPVADPRSRMVAVEGELANGDGRLRPGMLMEMELRVGHRKKALVAAAPAVYGEAGADWVWTVRAGKARRRALRVGLRTDEFVEVLDGLAAGESYVVGGGFGLVEGCEVRVVTRP